MKRIILAIICAALLAPLPALSALQVFACEPEWAALAGEIGGDRIEAFSATTAQQDPHHIEARPSLIARLRRADLLLCSGAELESGWLPMLLRQAANPRVQPGQPGHLEAAQVVTLLEIPQTLDRAQGDVHASGNPHLHLDPRRLARVAGELARRLAHIDPANAAHYHTRHEDFARRWQASIQDWERRGAPLRGLRVLSHHKNWAYLLDWLGMIEAGVLESAPGIAPGAGHLGNLVSSLRDTPAAALIRTPYQDERASERLSRLTGVPAVVLPYTVGGTPQAGDLFGLFEDTLRRLLEARR